MRFFARRAQNDSRRRGRNNRLREALKIVEEGIASAEDIETVMVLGFQWPVGPLGMRQGIRADWGQKK